MDFEIVELDEQVCAVVEGRMPLAELPAFFGRAFSAVFAEASRQGVPITGPPFAFYPEMPSDTVAVAGGFPVGGELTPSGDVVPFVLPAGRAVTVMHVGPYDTMEQTYATLQRWMADLGLVPAGHAWEIYLSDPEVEPDPSTWRTQIVWPLA